MTTNMSQLLRDIFLSVAKLYTADQAQMHHLLKTKQVLSVNCV